MAHSIPNQGDIVLANAGTNLSFTYIAPSSIISPVIGSGVVNDIPTFSGSIPPVFVDSGANIVNSSGNITVAPPPGKNIIIGSVTGSAILAAGGNIITVEASQINIHDLVNGNQIVTNGSGMSTDSGSNPNTMFGGGNQINVESGGIIINDSNNSNLIETSSAGLQVQILNSFGNAGDVLTSDGTQTNWVAPPPTYVGALSNMYSDNSGATVGAGSDYYLQYDLQLWTLNPNFVLQPDLNKIQNVDSVLHYVQVEINIAWTNGGGVPGIFDFLIIVNNFIDAYVCTNSALNGAQSPFHQKCSGVFPVAPGGGIQVYVHNNGAAPDTLWHADSGYDCCVIVTQLS